MHLTATTWTPENPRATAVLIHGITGSSTSWWRVAEHLRDRGHIVTAPDLRGHGNSPRPPTGYAFDDLVEDVVDTVGPEHDLLVGHSLGGTLALQAVATGALRARATILEDPVLVLDPGPATAVAESEISWQPPDVAAMGREQPSWRPEDLAGRILAHYQMDPSAVRHAWTENAPWDLTPLLVPAAAATRLAAVIPWPSPYVDEPVLDRLRTALGRDAVLEVPGCGHSVHREAFATFVAALDQVVHRGTFS